MNSSPGNDKTQRHAPVRANQDPSATQPVRTVRRKPQRKKGISKILILGIPIALLFVMGIAVTTGYMQGIRIRDDTEVVIVAQALKEQMDTGIDDLLAGHHDLARQRFEYILEKDPNYPGARELLDQTLLALNEPTPTPSPAASPTPTETPDMTSYDGIFGSAQSAFAREEWSTALDLLLILRGSDPYFRVAEVNQLMAISLRNLGMDELLQSLLEQGIYHITLAERFGPLDGQASSWRNSASFYTFANSYYGLDWKLSTEYFGQICAANIWGACRKYGESALEYAKLLTEEGDVCQAVQFYEIAFSYIINDGVAPTATEVFSLCQTATAPVPTGTITLTPTLEIFTPTATLPGGTPTPTPTTGIDSPTPTFMPETPTDTPMPTPDTPTPTPDTPTPTT